MAALRVQPTGHRPWGKAEAWHQRFTGPGRLLAGSKGKQGLLTVAGHKIAGEGLSRRRKANYST